MASEATVYIVLEDVNDDIPLFTEREQETVLEGEPIGTSVTRVNAIDKDGTFPNNQVYYGTRLVTKAKIISKSTNKRVKSSPKSSSIVRNRPLTPWKWRHVTEPLPHGPTATDCPIQVTPSVVDCGNYVVRTYACARPFL